MSVESVATTNSSSIVKTDSYVDALQAMMDKVHEHALEVFVMLSLVLTASVAIAFTISPLAFVSVGIFSLFWIKSIQMVLAQQKLEALSRPVGLANTGNNCFINSLFQCMINNPHLAEWIQSSPQSFQSFKDFMSRYTQAQEEGESLVSADSQALRLELRAQNGSIGENGQEDPSEMWQAISNRFLQDFNGKLIRKATNERTGEKSRVSMDTDYAIDVPLGGVEDGSSNNFSNRLNLFFYRSIQNETTGDVFEEEFKFQDVPPFLVLKLGRFTYRTDPNVQATDNPSLSDKFWSIFGYKAQPKQAPSMGTAYKIDEPFDCLERFPISNKIIENSDKDVNYVMDGFLVHEGSSLHAGHFKAFVKKDSKWYQCNDEVVTEIDQSEVDQMRKQAYMCFYHKA